MREKEGQQAHHREGIMMDRKLRENKLMLLGYNQAMLDWAKFPIRDGDAELTREQVQRVVADLRAALGK